MKKIIGFLLVVGLIFQVSTGALALSQEKQTELAMIREYIKLLDEDIMAAKTAGQTKKVEELQALKAKQIKQAKAIRAENESGEVEVSSQSDTKMTSKPRKVAKAVGVGFAGGSLTINGDLFFTGPRSIPMTFGLAYGFGNQYNIILANLMAKKVMDDKWLGVELTYASYSETITDVLGLGGNIDKGGKLGLGLAVGKKIRGLDLKLGYNTALGINVKISKKI